MIEIIPNWHPIFVHFTVALWSLAIIFHIVTPLLPEGSINQQGRLLSHWNLWLGTGFGVITAIAGWIAYNSVAHDAQSHVAMTEHRNWALVTLALFILLTGWSLWCERKHQQPSKMFLSALLGGGVLLTSTAWHGGELVYRYGLGVISLPQAEEGHSHSHGETSEQESPTQPEEEHDHTSGTQHELDH